MLKNINIILDVNDDNDQCSRSEEILIGYIKSYETGQKFLFKIKKFI